MGFGPFGVAVIEFDDQIVRLAHGSGNQLTHVRFLLRAIGDSVPESSGLP
jgi:hypothetical protein